MMLIQAMLPPLIVLLSMIVVVVHATICVSCATKQVVAHWNKFMNYRLINPRTGSIIDDHSCENPRNITCSGYCYIFQITGTGRLSGTKQLFGMAQGCAAGLFDDEMNEERCVDRPVTLRGRGGTFRLDGKYCFCSSSFCTLLTDIWLINRPKAAINLRRFDDNLKTVETKTADKLIVMKSVPESLNSGKNSLASNVLIDWSILLIGSLMATSF